MSLRSGVVSYDRAAATHLVHLGPTLANPTHSVVLVGRLTANQTTHGGLLAV